MLCLWFCLIFTRSDLYGESITVVRSVTNSSSTYKLKDHRGKVVAVGKVKEELDRVLMSFNIQVSGKCLSLFSPPLESSLHFF